MSKLPLRDRLVVLTRPEGRGADWKDALVEAGAAVSELPLLEIKFEPDDTVLSEVLDAMGEYDWVVFTSANGVRGFFDRFFERFTDIRSVGGVRFACLGPATEKALRQYHLDSDLTATQNDALSLGRELMTKHDVENQKLLVVTGNLNTPELPRLLADGAMAIVDVIKVYATEEKSVAESPEAAEFRRRGADFLGVNCWPGSPRCLPAAARAPLLREIPATKRVAVTVNPSVAEATALLAEGFAIVQAHFDPTKAECDPKALSAAVGPARLWLAPKLADGAEWPAELIPLAVGFVHDAHAKDAFGGTGKTSDWSRFAQLRKRYPDSQWLLAGGLGPDNILAAAASGADFFDLNSGIELAPGLKSAEKLSAVAEALLKNTQS